MDNLEKIKELLKETDRPMSYNEIGLKLDISVEDVKTIIGTEYKRLIGGCYKSIVFSGTADPDFFLFGDFVKELNENKYYQWKRKGFMKQIERRAKLENIRSKVL